jgi:hypothetical protein
MRMSEDRLGRVFWAGVGALILVAARNVFTIPKGTGSGFVRDEGGNVVTDLRSSPVRRTRAWG